MKINKIKKYRNNLFKLQLIKSKVYKKKNLSFNLNNVISYIKKITQIIYQYTTFNEKILFFGLHSNIKPLLKKTKHLVVPNPLFMHGLFTNSITKPNQKKIPFKIVQNILKLKQKFSLVVLFDTKNKQNNFILQESMKAQIPVIALSNLLDTITTNFFTYKIPGYFSLIHEKFTQKNPLFSILKIILRRATLKKYKSTTFKNKSEYLNKKNKKKRPFYYRPPSKFKKLYEHLKLIWDPIHLKCNTFSFYTPKNDYIKIKNKSELFLLKYFRNKEFQHTTSFKTFLNFDNKNKHLKKKPLLRRGPGLKQKILKKFVTVDKIKIKMGPYRRSHLLKEVKKIIKPYKYNYKLVTQYKKQYKIHIAQKQHRTYLENQKQYQAYCNKKKNLDTFLKESLTYPPYNKK